MKNVNLAIEEKLLEKSLDTNDVDQVMRITDVIAFRIQDKYDFRWEKCMDMAMQSEWWLNHHLLKHIVDPDIDAITASIFKQIDNNEIL